MARSYCLSRRRSLRCRRFSPCLMAPTTVTYRRRTVQFLQPSTHTIFRHIPKGFQSSHNIWSSKQPFPHCLFFFPFFLFSFFFFRAISLKHYFSLNHFRLSCYPGSVVNITWVWLSTARYGESSFNARTCFVTLMTIIGTGVCIMLHNNVCQRSSGITRIARKNSFWPP